MKLEDIRTTQRVTECGSDALTAPSAVPANGLWVENGVVKINA